MCASGCMCVYGDVHTECQRWRAVVVGARVARKARTNGDQHAQSSNSPQASSEVEQSRGITCDGRCSMHLLEGFHPRPMQVP